ncbi:hypothetical protein PMZ80_005587 [Knufia obscura]|uniref:Proline-rich protein LAS17 n=2 Tax=Knufia TaxID=430999 RepID=A0AAN8E9T4_9EURO|nr:hypothetical protein PMZ80_005587 [Knufia obscura]KAK5950054.1 hypothetical protein OHC33_009016 [Knufia fluminis]
MPSVLSDHDKENVKRLVPKASNKIQAVAVARLYIAKPGQSRWIYTGLQGAAVLSNDLVGNTFWIKMVDISPANRGVIWDQEIYDTFQYNQDRTFFHSFELEQCMAALSFMDEKEAKQFKKKMDEREKNASKATQRTPFGSAAGGAQVAHMNGGGGHKSHSRLGGLFGRNRNSSNPTPPQPQMSAPQPVYSSIPTGIGGSRPQSSGQIDLTDPTWRPILDELVQMGITEDQIAQNADFIRSYVQQKQAEEMASGIASALPQQNSGRAPPPPPPPGPPAAQRLTPDNTGTTTSSRRGPPPAPPPSRKAAPGRPPSPPREPSPVPTPSPPSTPQPRGFRVPPPLADAGKFAKDIPTRPRASSGAALANPGPPPPPRPPKEADDEIPGQVFRAPPPFTGQRQSSAPQPPPSRGPVPPPPPSRDTTAPSRGAVPPPPPSRTNAAPVPPPLPPTNNRPIPPPPTANNLPPPPPPMPPTSAGPPPPPPMPPMSSSGPPPPPPMPPSGAGGPPPPPLPPGAANPPPLPSVGGDRGDLLASIRGSGAGGLRKVKDTEKRDRSAAAVPGAESAAPPPPGGAPAPPEAGLAGALQAALQKRKQKVSGSDDEKDDDDDW